MMGNSKSFEIAKEFLGKEVVVEVDRPLGTKHPKHDYKYPVNYGFIKGTMAPDGAELDAYILGVNEPQITFIGICKAIIHRADDDDDKLVVMPAETELTDGEILEQVNFQEQYFNSEVVRS